MENSRDSGEESPSAALVPVQDAAPALALTDILSSKTGEVELFPASYDTLPPDAKAVIDTMCTRVMEDAGPTGVLRGLVASNTITAEAALLFEEGDILGVLGQVRRRLKMAEEMRSVDAGVADSVIAMAKNTLWSFFLARRSDIEGLTSMADSTTRSLHFLTLIVRARNLNVVENKDLGQAFKDIVDLHGECTKKLFNEIAKRIAQHLADEGMRHPESLMNTEVKEGELVVEIGAFGKTSDKQKEQITTCMNAFLNSLLPKNQTGGYHFAHRWETRTIGTEPRKMDGRDYELPIKEENLLLIYKPTMNP